jgi:hypothetical protein
MDTFLASTTSVDASSNQPTAREVASFIASGESTSSFLAFHHSVANDTCLSASSNASLRRPASDLCWRPILKRDAKHAENRCHNGYQHCNSDGHDFS